MVEHYLYLIPALAIAITVHEFSHAWVANYLGDPTAKHEGRVSLNPLAHLDLIGTLMIFFIGIGWGKPVPVNPDNFRNPKRDQALVSLAGPLANLLTAMVVSVPLKYATSPDLLWLQFFSFVLFELSIVLFVFNMFPFPPLDGSKILGLFIPDRWYRQYLYYLHDGMKYFVAFIFIDVFIFERIFQFSVFGSIISTISQYVKALVLIGT